MKKNKERLYRNYNDSFNTSQLYNLSVVIGEKRRTINE
jgi:hypothetical protein